MTDRELVEVSEGEDEALAGQEGRGRMDELVKRELGEDAARELAVAWRAQDEWDRQRRPREGLRERKKRETRQRISDVATALFVTRGFDRVTVSEIAEKVGVSEKTIYNYFPTKEALVFDQADEQLQLIAAALRQRPPGVAPSSVIIGVLREEMAHFEAIVGPTPREFLPAFGAMIRDSPSLRAAVSEHRHRLVEAVTEILAADVGIDPRDPEPVMAARALVSLVELFYDSYLRHVADGVTTSALLALVESDLERGARLIDTGLWSFHLMVEGRRTKQQLVDAAITAEQARKQVVAAVRQAKRAWRELRDEQREARARGRRERH